MRQLYVYGITAFITYHFPWLHGLFASLLIKQGCDEQAKTLKNSWASWCYKLGFCWLLITFGCVFVLPEYGQKYIFQCIWLASIFMAVGVPVYPTIHFWIGLSVSYYLPGLMFFVQCCRQTTGTTATKQNLQYFGLLWCFFSFYFLYLPTTLPFAIAQPVYTFFMQWLYFLLIHTGYMSIFPVVEKINL